MCCQAAEHCRIQRLQDERCLGRQGQDDYIGSSCQLNYSQADVATVIVHYELLCLIMSSMSQEIFRNHRRNSSLSMDPLLLVLYNEPGGPFATSDVAGCFLKMSCGNLFEQQALMQTLALTCPCDFVCCCRTKPVCPATTARGKDSELKPFSSTFHSEA